MLLSGCTLALVTILFSSHQFPAVAALPKVLCLHGGGQTASGFQAQLSDLTKALSSQYEFLFPQGPESGSLWVRDPPGGKGAPSTDADWASSSVAMLDDYVATNGPFEGILGYSQGSMFATYYLSVAPAGTFSFAIMFCGYLPTTHTGLLNSINAQAPFNDIPALVFMAVNDGVITNSLTDAQAAKFTSPTRVTSNSAGHAPPSSGDSTFNSVVTFIRASTNNSSGSTSGDGNDVKSFAVSQLQPSGISTLLILLVSAANMLVAQWHYR